MAELGGGRAAGGAGLSGTRGDRAGKTRTALCPPPSLPSFESSVSVVTLHDAS